MKNSIFEAIIPITLISLLLLSFIIIVRVVFYIIIWFFSKIYLKNKRNNKNKLSSSNNIVVYKKEEDELFRNKNNEIKRDKIEFNLQGVEKINQEMTPSMDIEDDTKIVGIAKPIGFWTSLILGDQLSQILGKAQALKSKSHKGFWVSMLEAQARGLGRQKGQQK